MMKKQALIVLVGCSILAQNSFAQSFSQTRFTTLTQGTKAALSQVVQANPGIYAMTAEQQAEIMVSSGDRNNAFAIEGLSRVYQAYPVSDVASLITDVGTISKDLEDLIGNYDKYAGGQFPSQAQQTADSLSSGVFGANGFADDTNFLINGDRLQGEASRIGLKVHDLIGLTCCV